LFFFAYELCFFTSFISISERLAAIRRASTAIYKSTVDPEFSSEDDNIDEEPSPSGPVTISRNRSTRMARTHSTGVTNSAPKSGINPINSSSAHSKSTNYMSLGQSNIGSDANSGTSAEQKAAALSKYRRYVALNTTTGPTNTNNYPINTSSTNNTDKSNVYSAIDNTEDDVDVESSFIDTGSRVDSTHHTDMLRQTKWSDVGKHERLFDHVDILKAPGIVNNGKSNGTKSVITNLDTNNSASKPRKSQPTAEYEPVINAFTHPTLNTACSNHNKTAFKYSEDLNNSTTSIHSPASNLSHQSQTNTNDSVEIFVEVNSNPPSPARTKPNNKVFKPPFSKPVFNEFTQNTKAKKSEVDGSVNDKGDSG